MRQSMVMQVQMSDNVRQDEMSIFYVVKLLNNTL